MGKLDQYCFDGTNALSLKKLPTDSKKDQVDKETILAKTEKNQEKIFDPFYRVDKSRSRAMGGAGLGLALVSEIARQHNGQVKVTQSSEKGSTIALILPELTDY